MQPKKQLKDQYIGIFDDKIVSVQICHSGAEVGLNHFPFDLTFKV